MKRAMWKFGSGRCSGLPITILEKTCPESDIATSTHLKSPEWWFSWKRGRILCTGKYTRRRRGIFHIVSKTWAIFPQNTR